MNPVQGGSPGDATGLALVLLDCDGVLFDSFAANVAYYDRILATMGRPALDAAGRDLAHRLSTPQLFAQLLGDDPELLRRSLEIAHETDYAPYYALMQPVPQLRETLGWLRDRYDTALATNRGKTIPGLLQGWDLGSFFGLVVGMNDVPRPKPAPDMLLRCTTHFGVPPDRALYVGDSPSDATAARAAGIRFLAVGDAVPGAPRIPRFAELPAWLRQLA